MVEVDLYGIMVNNVLVNKVFFPNSTSLGLEFRALQNKYGAKNVTLQPLKLVDDKNVYNPYSGGKHQQFSSDLAYSKIQYAG